MSGCPPVIPNTAGALLGVVGQVFQDARPPGELDPAALDNTGVLRDLSGFQTLLSEVSRGQVVSLPYVR